MGVWQKWNVSRWSRLPQALVRWCSPRRPGEGPALWSCPALPWEGWETPVRPPQLSGHSSVISRGLSRITSRSLCSGVDLADSVRALCSKALASVAVRVSSERPRPFWSSSGRLLRSVASSVPVLPCTMWMPSGPLSSVGSLWRKRRLPWPGLRSPGSSSSSVWISCKRPGSPNGSGTQATPRSRPCSRAEQVNGPRVLNLLCPCFLPTAHR